MKNRKTTSVLGAVFIVSAILVGSDLYAVLVEGIAFRWADLAASVILLGLWLGARAGTRDLAA